MVVTARLVAGLGVFDRDTPLFWASFIVSDQPVQDVVRVEVLVEDLDVGALGPFSGHYPSSNLSILGECRRR